MKQRAPKMKKSKKVREDSYLHLYLKTEIALAICLCKNTNKKILKLTVTLDYFFQALILSDNLPCRILGANLTCL